VLIVPVIPTTLSLRTLDQIRRFVKKRKIRKMVLLPFFSMVDRRKQLHRMIYANREDYGDFLDVSIPFSSAVEKMGITRAPLVSYDHSGKASKAFQRLWTEIRQHSDD
jgi:cellulose biosynthesis protein BcsQ